MTSEPIESRASSESGVAVLGEPPELAGAPGYATLDDETLMARYVRGDTAAFTALFDRYAPRLDRAVRRQVRSPEDAREIVQQTFLQLHRARFDFQEGRALRPWVYTICFNLRREHFRRRRRRPEAPLELDGRCDPRAEPLDLLAAERALEVRRAVSRLPAGQREVIELHWFEEMPFQEIGEVLGASTTAVKVRAHRGYERLRRTLQSHRTRLARKGGANPGALTGVPSPVQAPARADTR